MRKHSIGAKNNGLACVKSYSILKTVINNGKLITGINSALIILKTFSSCVVPSQGAFLAKEVAPFFYHNDGKMGIMAVIRRMFYGFNME